jgi:hypothetical protein
MVSGNVFIGTSDSQNPVAVSDIEQESCFLGSQHLLPPKKAEGGAQFCRSAQLAIH